MSYIPQKRCSECGYVGAVDEWVAWRKVAHAEKLERAREACGLAWESLVEFTRLSEGEILALARVIDAKIELALLERGGE
jgi:hypothetical protein